MSNLTTEISKIKKYMDNNGAENSLMIYQIMGVLFFAGFFYRYVFSKLVTIDPLLDKDMALLFIIGSLFCYGIWFSIKEKKLEKIRAKIIFEQVNVFDFINSYEKDVVKVEINYIIISGKIIDNINKYNKIKASDLARFKEEINNKTLSYNSMEVYKYMKYVKNN